MTEKEYYKVLKKINSLIDPKDIDIKLIKEFWREFNKRVRWDVSATGTLYGSLTKCVYESSKQNSRVPPRQKK